MKNEEVGYVIESENGMAKIKVGRHSDCKNCGACPGSNSIILTVKNPIEAQIGQKVAFQVKENKMLSSVYIVYIQPLLLTILGVIIGYFIATYMHSSIKFFEIFIGGIFFILSLICIGFIEKKCEKDKERIPVITKILQ